MNYGVYLNIGNTHVQAGFVRDGRVCLASVYETPSVVADGLLPELEGDTSIKASAVCVVPEARIALSERYGERLRFLELKDFSRIDFSLVDSSTIGMDRLANAAAARTVAGGPVIVVDCGTCINTVVVDGCWRFLGGAIMPGRQIMRRALHDFTAQLPLIEIKNTVPPPVGKCTAEAMAAGTDLAAIGALREILSGTIQRLEPEKFTIYATGGDAGYFLAALPSILRPAPELLTLHGTFLTAEGL